MTGKASIQNINWKQIIRECLRPNEIYLLPGSKRLNNPFWFRVRALLLLLLGSFLSAIAINMFFLPFQFIMGGLSGIAAIVYYLTHGFIPFGTLTFVLNVPLLILGLKELGYRFIWKSLVGTFAFSGVIDLTAPLMKRWIAALNVPMSNGQYPDPLLWAIIGGIIFGIGLGIIFLGGYTTGGTDILAVFISKKMPNITLGKIILGLDLSIIAATLFIPHDELQTSPVLLAVYSFLSLFLQTKSIDAVIAGLDFSRMALIISDHAETIADAILKHLGRGVTGLQGRGMYTKSGKEVLLCVLSSRQVSKLRELVKSIDDKAFVIVNEAREVYGEGFLGDKSLF